MTTPRLTPLPPVAPPPPPAPAPSTTDAVRSEVASVAALVGVKPNTDNAEAAGAQAIMGLRDTRGDGDFDGSDDLEAAAKNDSDAEDSEPKNPDYVPPARQRLDLSNIPPAENKHVEVPAVDEDSRVNPKQLVDPRYRHSPHQDLSQPRNRGRGTTQRRASLR